MNPFLTATEARAKSRNDFIVFTEIRSLEEAVLTAINEGLYTTVDVTGTTMTWPEYTGSVADDVLKVANIEEPTDDQYDEAVYYYRVWAGTEENRAKNNQMNAVITYFTNLGYSIDRVTNPTTGETFRWVISW